MDLMMVKKVNKDLRVISYGWTHRRTVSMYIHECGEFAGPRVGAARSHSTSQRCRKRVQDADKFSW